jgi:hypothetical protein
MRIGLPTAGGDLPARWLLSSLAAVALGCPEAEGPPPWGFAQLQSQRFRITADETMQIDGEEVRIERLADARLSLDSHEDGRSELVLYLDRYYMRVVGGPGGDTEFVLSDAGLVSRGGPAGEILLSPQEEAPGGGTIAQLLDKPVGGVFVNGRGETQSSAWQSYDPFLSGIRLVDWVLFGFPTVGPPPPAVWDGSRVVPAIGKYALGIEVPLRYESRLGDDGRTSRVRSSGVIERSDLRIAPGLRGGVRLDESADARLDGEGRLLGSRLELRMSFDGADGTKVSSVHRFEVRCRDCGEPEVPEAPVNPFADEPDTAIQ